MMHCLYSGIIPTSIWWQLVAVLSQNCGNHQHQYVEIVAGSQGVEEAFGYGYCFLASLLIGLFLSAADAWRVQTVVLSPARARLL